jgi:hypothetical protein
MCKRKKKDLFNTVYWLKVMLSISLTNYETGRDYVWESKGIHATFLTKALDVAEWSQLHPPAALPPSKLSPEPTGYEGGWATQPVSKLWRRAKLIFLAGNRTLAVRSPSLLQMSYFSSYGLFIIQGNIFPFLKIVILFIVQ